MANATASVERKWRTTRFGVRSARLASRYISMRYYVFDCSRFLVTPRGKAELIRALLGVERRFVGSGLVLSVCCSCRDDVEGWRCQNSAATTRQLTEKQVVESNRFLPTLEYQGDGDRGRAANVYGLRLQSGLVGS